MHLQGYLAHPKTSFPRTPTVGLGHGFLRESQRQGMSEVPMYRPTVVRERGAAPFEPCTRAPSFSPLHVPPRQFWNSLRIRCSSPLPFFPKIMMTQVQRDHGRVTLDILHGTVSPEESSSFPRPSGPVLEEIGISLPNNQRQHRTLHIQKEILLMRCASVCPVFLRVTFGRNRFPPAKPLPVPTPCTFLPTAFTPPPPSHTPCR
jgi:hypothetical protein